MIESYSILKPLVGGFCIGLAACLMLFWEGRVLGFSGIIFQACTKQLTKLTFERSILIGLILGVFIHSLLSGRVMNILYFGSFKQIILAGFLVGLGTRLGRGCTSGHGICGLARCSKRSIIATVVFMLVGVLTVMMIRQWGEMIWS